MLDRLETVLPGMSGASRDASVRLLCQHPLLLAGVEDALAPELCESAPMRMIGLSAKFVCLYRCLTALRQQRRPAVVLTRCAGLLPLLAALCRHRAIPFAAL
jgi:hypothetical protein